MRVAIIAPPWLALPIKGYGGIELVLEGLIDQLQVAGVDVEVFGNTERTMDGVTTHALYEKEQFYNIDRPMYESLPILAAHMQYALMKIKADGKFDVIHDHNGYLGPELLAWATNDPSLPPVVHTLHGPPFTNRSMLEQGLPDNRPYWDQLARNMGRMYIIGISDGLIKTAPDKLREHILPTVHNAINVNNFLFSKEKKDYFITLARFTRDKGQHIAAKICAKRGFNLRMAGTVSGIGTNDKLLLEITNPHSLHKGLEGFRYYSDKVLPYVLKNKNIMYCGNVSGGEKLKFISESKGLLFPINWEEPFGMAVIEALACGTPVIAMNRGAMPEIIEHGVTGFLADNEKEFEEYMDRIDEIDPNVCRESMEKKFSASRMAAEYVKRYEQAIRLNGKSV